MARFITLAGKKQVGKDTSANMLAEMLACRLSLVNGVHIVHFADALKKACHIIFGIPLEDMETEEGKQKLTHVRWPVDIMPSESEDELMSKHHLWVAWTSYCEEFPDDPIDEEFMIVRQVLQFVGTELFRNQLDPDVWLNSVFLKPWAEDDIVIIADARFPNEAALGRKNGLLISVERDTGLVSDGHKSENALGDYTDYHHMVDNNASFDALRSRLNTILVAHDLLV